MSEYKLTEEIIKLSQSQLWDVAKSEWTLHEIYEANEPERCYVGTFLSLKFVILRTRSTLTMRLLETAALKSSLVYLQIKFSKQ